MAFFEQIGKKLSDAGQSVAQQTKNFSDVTRLNGAFSEKERKIAQLYQAIGMAYYAARKCPKGPRQGGSPGSAQTAIGQSARKTVSAPTAA